MYKICQRGIWIYQYCKESEFRIIINKRPCKPLPGKTVALLILLFNFPSAMFFFSFFQLIIDFGIGCSCSLTYRFITEFLCLPNIKGKFLLPVLVSRLLWLPEKNNTQKHSLPRTHHQIYTDSSLIELSSFLFGTENDLPGAVFFNLSALKPAAVAGSVFPGIQGSEGDMYSR